MDFKDLVWKIMFSQDSEFVLSKLDVDEKLETEKSKNSLLLNENKNLSELLGFYKDEEEAMAKAKELENHWNRIRPKTTWKYPARPDPDNNDNRVIVDPRIFYQYETTIPRLTSGTVDDKASAILKYVIRNITYTSDVKSGGEYWQFPYETFHRKKGDCFAYYEEIYTKDGLKSIRDIDIGDEVLSYDFDNKTYVYKKVSDKWMNGKLQVNRVHFRNGQHIDVSENHPMWHRTLQKESNYEKQYLSDIDLTRWWKRKVPIAKKIPYNIEDIGWLTEDLCIVLGHFLAEGSIYKSSVSSSGYDLIEDIIPLLEKYDIPFSESVNNSGVPVINFLKSGFKDFLKAQKKDSFDIHLKDYIFKLPSNKLEKLLYGMWIGDGTKLQYDDKRGFANNKEWTYSTSSKQLSDDIQRIGLQLGRTFHIWKQEDHKGVGDKPIYRINFNSQSHFMKDFGYNGISEVSISRIEKMNNVVMYDLTVEDTHTVIMKNGIIIHQCEDGAILMANMMIRSGIPYWRIRLNAGMVKGGGHAYVTYLREKDNQWYVMDWCYWPDESVDFKKSWKDAEKYFGIWGSWNTKYVYGELPKDE